jgi:hypothetical protein
LQEAAEEPVTPRVPTVPAREVAAYLDHLEEKNETGKQERRAWKMAENAFASMLSFFQQLHEEHGFTAPSPRPLSEDT